MSDELPFLRRMGLIPEPERQPEAKPANVQSVVGAVAPPPPPPPARPHEPSPVHQAIPPRAAPATPPGGADLADHFLGCARLGRYLTVADSSRFIITDDFRTTPMIPEASAMAAIFSKDHLVAEAALLPLSARAQRMSVKERDKLERLFALIEAQTLSDGVRISARSISEHHFRAAEIRALEAELGDRMSPARLRYRQFLDVAKKLMDQKITAGSFLDEFRSFTQEVAGRLDFGIYSLCLDRLFASVRVPNKVKKLLILELIKCPPMVRRELLSNALAFSGQTRELVNFIRHMVTTELGQSVSVEIELLEAFKQRRLSMQDIEGGLAQAAGSQTN